MRRLVQYGLLFEQAGLLCGDEILFNKEVVLGFLCAMKEGQLTAEEMERFRGQRKIRSKNKEHKATEGKN